MRSDEGHEEDAIRMRSVRDHLLEATAAHEAECPGGKVVLEGVVAVCVRPSGTHRLEAVDGHRWIIAPGWHAIELEVDGWTF